MSNTRKSICSICNQEYWNTVDSIVSEHNNPRSATHVLASLKPEQRKDLVGLGSIIDDDVVISGGDTAYQIHRAAANCEKCGNKVQPNEYMWCAQIGPRDGDYEYWCRDCLPEVAEKYSIDAITQLLAYIEANTK